VRFRFALVLMVAGLLFAAGIASAQTTTTTQTDPTSGYTNTTPTETQPTSTTKKPTQTTKPETEADEEDSVAPSVAAQPAASAPDNLAFTGGEPLLLIAFGLALTGGTVALLVRDRRRGHQR
jgi:hypothetical protein